VDLVGLDKLDLIPRLRRNILSPVFFTLKNFLITSSTEVIELYQTKTCSSNQTCSRIPSPKKRSKTTERAEDNEYIFEDIPVAQVTISSNASPPSTPLKKRDFSGDSFDTISIEITPTKITEGEQRTQDLQSKLIDILINYIWDDGAHVPWARNRIIYMDYRPYSFHIYSLIASNFTSSFRCRLEGNNGDVDDRIIVKPDGALVLVRDKKSISNQRKIIWSL
jgi:hypothetical protein